MKRAKSGEGWGGGGRDNEERAVQNEEAEPLVDSLRLSGSNLVGHGVPIRGDIYFPSLPGPHCLFLPAGLLRHLSLFASVRRREEQWETAVRVP
jgi:hypothetical protein